MTPHHLRVRQQGRLFLSLLIVLIVLILLAAGGWWGWQQYQRLEGDRADQGQRLSALQQTLQQTLQQLRQQVQTQSREQEQALASLRDHQERLAARQARDRELLFDVRKGGQRLWLINEAEALASLASQRLLLTGDAVAARRLLQAADRSLAHIGDPMVLPARQALAVDMEKLDGALQVDVQGLILRLGALRKLVPDLVVPIRPKQPSSQQPTDAEKSGWQQFLEHLPIHIHRYDEKVPLPLTEAQATLVRLSLEADLQRAQLALVQSRYPVYQDALASARRTLEHWFRDDAARVQQMRQSLKELSASDVKMAMPDIGAGLAAIRQLEREIARSQNRAVPATSATGHKERQP